MATGGKTPEAEEAAPQEGDVLLTWACEGANGEFESPFDLSQVKLDQSPRGTVTINGLRGAEMKRWTLGRGNWNLTTRPMLQDDLLARYRAGEVLAQAGRLKEAAREWAEAAQVIDGSKSVLLRAWFLFHTAELFATASQWEDADRSYQEAIKEARPAGPSTSAQLLRSWALSYQKRRDWSDAEKYFQQAMTESHKISSENLLAAMILSDLGKMADQRGDLSSAEDYDSRALAIQEKLSPQSLGVAASVNNLGVVAWRRGDLAKAEEFYRKALTIREALAPESADVAASLNNLGMIAWQRRDLAKAEEYHHRALIMRQRLSPESLEVAASFTNLGNVAFDHEDLAKAQELYEKALAIEEKLSPEGFEMAFSLNNLGVIAARRGELTKAEDYYRRTLSIHERLSPGSQDLANGLNNLGNVARGRGDLTEANEYYHRALVIEQKLAPHSIVMAACLNNLGNVAVDQGELPMAQEYFLHALEIQKQLAPQSLYVAGSFNNLGAVAGKRGERATAEDYYQRALAIEEKLAPESVSLGVTLHDLGDLSRDGDDLPKAEEYYRKALAISDKLQPGTGRQAEILASLADIMRRQQQPDEAARLFDRTLNAFENQAAELGGGEEIRAGFRARHEAYYKSYIDLLIAQKQPERAFRILELSRARTLLEMMTATHVNIRKGVAPALLEREHSLQASFRGKSNRRIQLLNNKHTDEQLTALDREIKDLLGQYHEVEGEIRVSSPAYAALMQPQPLSAQEIRQQLLDADTVLLEYSLGKERSYVFVVTLDALEVYELPTRAEIENKARRVYELLTARNQPLPGETLMRRQRRVSEAETEYGKQAIALSRLLLGPVLSELGKKRLLIVGDGALLYIPFGVLPRPVVNTTLQTPLMLDHEIVNLPSASVLAVLRRGERERKEAANAVAVLADPVFSDRDARVKTAGNRQSVQTGPGKKAEAFSPPEDSLTRSVRDMGMTSLPRLPFTRQEAAAIMAAAPAGRGMEALDFQASRFTATSPALRQFRIVHLATHSLLDNDRPELSGLVLSLVDKRGMRQDGFLPLEDIYNLDLPVDLVVLSACDTGLGKQINGEGLLSLTRGFMYAGASRVVASLWSVDDVATAELMGRFYRGMLRQGLSPAAALQRAQVQMWKQKRWSNPYYWGAFVMQGEWLPGKHGA